jgi:hypothetical protein
LSISYNKSIDSEVNILPAIEEKANEYAARPGAKGDRAAEKALTKGRAVLIIDAVALRLAFVPSRIGRLVFT